MHGNSMLIPFALIVLQEMRDKDASRVENRTAHEVAIASREAEIAALKTKASTSSKKANSALAKAAQSAQAVAKVCART